MICYTYECQEHGEFDVIMSMKDMCSESPCPSCGEPSRKVIAGIGGVQCDSINDVKWLPSAVENLLPDGHKPITSRSEYNRHLRENNIVERG